MIEAVNSVVANAQVDRTTPSQVDAARAYAANPERVQEARPVVQAPYISPYVVVDVEYDKAVLQIRDSDTGDVLKQFPSETVLQARIREQANEEARVSRAADAGSSDSVQSGDGAESGFVSTPSFDFAPSNVPARNPQAELASASLIAAAQTAQASTSSVSFSA